MAPAKRAAARRSSKRASGEVAVKEVTVMINGEVTGTMPDSGTLLDAAKTVARERGLKSFSIKLNGTKVTAPQASQQLRGARTLELITKDARG